MIQPVPITGLCIRCDQACNISHVLRDDNEILLQQTLPVSFFSLFDNISQQKPREFWNTLQQESAIFDWELNTGINGQTEVYRFSGIVTETEVFITALKQDKALGYMMDELMGMYNEQQNILRNSLKQSSTLKKSSNNQEVNFLNEMTGLNNELVNTHRKLVNQNAEITSLNSRLQDVNAELEQFTYVASHDLKEPLRMVNSFMTLLKNKYGNLLDEKAHDYINFAIDGGLRMNKMINDLLELSRITHQNIAREAVDINDIVRDVTANIFKLVEENHAEIIIESTLPILPVIKSDITRLLQNLVSNAIKFRKKGTNPIIRINAKEQSNQWLFSIADNGIGIEQEKFKKIFEIFARLHSSKTHEGSGIGLAICKKIAEKNGGKIWIASEEGIGSIFYFTILKTKL
jgi:signal transduction histidine kinase